MTPLFSFPENSEHFLLEPGSGARFRAFTQDTDGVMEMLERELEPGQIGADTHVHKDCVETFYVLEGTAAILCGEEVRDCPAGSVVVVPKNTVHGYGNRSTQPVRVLIIFSPGRNQNRFFRELAQLKAGPRETYVRDLAALREKFDSVSVPRPGSYEQLTGRPSPW